MTSPRNYVGQRGSKYADCVPLVMVNACRFYGLSCPDPYEAEQWEPVVDFAGCRHGGATVGVEKLADHFGLQATRIPAHLAVRHAPLFLAVYNPEVGHNTHAVLVVGWEKEVATVIDYRTEKGPLREQVPLVRRESLPKRADGALDRGVLWRGMAIPTCPNADCFLLEPLHRGGA